MKILRCYKKAADLVFSNLFVIRCVRIERKLDVCHPLTGQFRQELTELVLQEWNASFGDESESKA